QILKNLLANAFKFTHKGSITLQVRPSGREHFLEFIVRDTGIGIPEDRHQMIFEAFQQADGSTRRKYGGTGLGLSISRELARLLGGEIALKSTEGIGSEFILSLPVDINKTPEIIAKPEKEKTFYPVEEPAEQRKRFIVDHIPHAIDDDRNNIIDGDKVILIIEDDTSFA